MLGGGGDDLWDGNFEEVAFDEEFPKDDLEKLSDHCPLAVRLDLLVR